MPHYIDSHSSDDKDVSSVQEKSVLSLNSLVESNQSKSSCVYVNLVELVINLLVVVCSPQEFSVSSLVCLVVQCGSPVE